MGDIVFLKVDVTKIPKSWLFKGTKGTYADIAVYENEQPDEYGNTHAVKMNPPKAVKDADPNAKGVYIGNGKRLERRDGGGNYGGQSQARPATGQQSRQQARPQGRQGGSELDNIVGGDLESDDIPFQRPHYLMVGGV